MNENQHNAYMKVSKAWDELDAAALRVITALPAQMTKAAEDLDVARIEMRMAINSYLLKALYNEPVGP